MPKASKSFVLALLVLLILSTLFCKKHTEEKVESLSAEEYSRLRSGDLVFRLGYGMVSFMLEKQAGASGVSHVGVLAKDSSDFYVIHSISGKVAEQDGAQTASLDRFLYEAKPQSFVAIRLKNSDGEAIANEARRLLAKKVPFDLAFDIKDTNRLFCSSFANLILKNTHGVEVFSEDAREFPFSVFFDTAKFEIVVDKRL